MVTAVINFIDSLLCKIHFLFVVWKRDHKRHQLFCPSDLKYTEECYLWFNNRNTLKFLKFGKSREKTDQEKGKWSITVESFCPPIPLDLQAPNLSFSPLFSESISQFCFLSFLPVVSHFLPLFQQLPFTQHFFMCQSYATHFTSTLHL